ncbi:MAG: DUF882 domain-containing protein [Burkholderiaceae bacterium]
MQSLIQITRRRWLMRQGARAASLGAAALALPARAGSAHAIALVHTHTRESIDIVYARGGQVVPEAMAAINRFLRDHYTGDVGVIDPALLDQLQRVRLALGSARAFEVISGYRSPHTNARLRAQGGGGVAQHSLHMEGRAIDVRLPGTALAELRDAALDLHLGGVGFYAREAFVHLDSGRVRHW